MPGTQTRSSPLVRLAAHAGILPGYVDQTGKEKRTTSDETRRLLLGALGIDASTDAAVRESYEAIRAAAREELIAPVRVVEQGTPAARMLEASAPPSRARSGPWRLELELEHGERHMTEGPWRGDTALELALPAGLPLGYHTLRLTFSAGGSEWMNEQRLIIVPGTCVTPDDLLGGGSAFGLVANLYTVRSANNWGIGDFTDLGTLAEWAAAVGAEFVGVNPLHALLNRGTDVSPYRPVSRLFRNSIYIDVAAVPELRLVPELAERIRSPEMRSQLDALRSASAVRYEQVMGVKGLALDALHRVFADRVQGSGDVRDRAYREFVTQRGEPLTRFATWMAIAEQNGNGTDWRAWPGELQDAGAQAVQRFAAEHAQRIDFHTWLQFEADRQLELAATRAADAGMRIGLYEDLAIGTSPTGADTWAFPELFVQGASIGAPPDPYSATGQNWGLPPLDPRAMRSNRYQYFIDLVRSGFRHAGALRIDHVMGLFRLFWIPEGKTGVDGAYVRYPADDLLGIVALESARHNAVVVGEDLGTVPKDVPPALEKWGILSSKVLYFERNSRGAFKPAERYPRLALATANTHDMPTIAGFWAGRDIDVRAEVGLIANDEDAERARDERETDRGALLQRLRAEKIIPRGHTPATPAELRGAVHAFLCRTPSQLVGLSLDDLAGEVEPVNVPGVGPDKYPSWTRKMRLDLATITSSDDVRAALRCKRTR
jgi:4-alpha-glucanotransferase